MVALKLQQFQCNLKKIFLRRVRRLGFPMLSCQSDDPPRGGVTGGGGGSCDHPSVQHCQKLSPTAGMPQRHQSTTRGPFCDIGTPLSRIPFFCPPLCDTMGHAPPPVLPWAWASGTNQELHAAKGGKGGAPPFHHSSCNPMRHQRLLYLRQGRTSAKRCVASYPLPWFSASLANPAPCTSSALSKHGHHVSPGHF